MKYLFICILILLSTSLSAQSSVRSRTGKPIDKSNWHTAYRNYSENDTNYVVKYVYFYADPLQPDRIYWRYDSILKKAVSDAEARRPYIHYIADITVYRLKNNDSLIVGKTFEGQYVPIGCFEDKPKDMVAKAKDIKKD